MNKPSKARGRVKKGKRGHYLLRLFMAGNGLNSKTALVNLRSLCKEHLNGSCTIETVDVVKDFQAALRDNILVTPALILVAPHPRVMILGNLSDSPTVLAALRLPGLES
ncbi:MAG TPA: circadian clock KaiB family protein [Phycisphaerae bacterium]|nr:circadian clock KaiB family protein [Phycisphaerae bacterium]